MQQMPIARRRLMALSGGLVSFVTTAALADETTLEKARRQGYINVGFANEVPYGYVTPDGKLTGESPEVVRAVLKQIGIPQIHGVLTEFGSLIPGLQAHRFDIIAAGMFITPPRCKQVQFSEPTYAIGEALLVKKGNPDNLHDFGSIAANPKLKLAVEAGAIESTYATQSGVKLDQLVILPDQPSLVSAVQSGRANAAALTALSIGEMASKNTGVEATPSFYTVAGKKVVGYGGIAFRKQDKSLYQAFNTALKKFIGSPEHIALVTPFGFGKGFLPGNVTTAQICAGQ